MSAASHGDRCERCKRGYAGPLPREDLEWLDPSDQGPPGSSGRRLRVARCTRCGSFLAVLSVPDRDRPGAEIHDVCVVHHEQARSALIGHDPLSLAAVSPQLRRRHLEELVARMQTGDRRALERIERGDVQATEAFRGLATRALAQATELPAIGDVRPRSPVALRTPRGPSAAAAVGMRTALELGDGSRTVLDVSRDVMTLTRMRGDAVAWRRELPTRSREGCVARVVGRPTVEFVVLVGPSPGEDRGELFLVSGSDGAIRGPGRHDLRAASFEAHGLPGRCTFIASYQHCAIVREDAEVCWKGSAAGFPVAIPSGDGCVLVDAPWRLVGLSLPDGVERWSVPVDRNATLSPSGEGHLLVTTSDVVSRFDVRSERPRLVWAATGASPLPLASGGAALVRERWDKAGRSIECVVLDAQGRRRFAVGRPEATKNPTAELAPGVLLYHAGGDLAVSVQDRVTYALSLPAGTTAGVVTDDAGAWVEYEGIVDRIDQTGRRAGRWRVG